MFVAFVIGALLWWLNARKFETSDNAFIDAHIVRLAPQIAGRVTQVVGILSLLLVNTFVDWHEALLRDRNKPLAGGPKVDVVGFVLVALFLGCMEATLERGTIH